MEPSSPIARAAALWGLRASARGLVDVTVPGRAGRSREGIDVHSGDTLTPADVTTVDGIPCTTVARTLLDLAEVVDRRQVERAIEQAEILDLFDGRQMDDGLAGAFGRRGAPVLRAVLDDLAIGDTVTRRELEERFFALCDAAGIPRPRVNEWVTVEGAAALQVDFLWPDRRLIVETDSRRFHHTRQAFERDRERDQRLTLAGYRVVRITWRQLTREPGRIADTIRRPLDLPTHRAVRHC